MAKNWNKIDRERIERAAAIYRSKRQQAEAQARRSAP